MQPTNEDEKHWTKRIIIQRFTDILDKLRCSALKCRKVLSLKTRSSVTVYIANAKLKEKASSVCFRWVFLSLRSFGSWQARLPVKPNTISFVRKPAFSTLCLQTLTCKHQQRPTLSAPLSSSCVSRNCSTFLITSPCTPHCRRANALLWLFRAKFAVKRRCHRIFCRILVKRHHQDF